MMTTARMVYLSHGGGPLPLLGDRGHMKMVDFMKALPNLLAPQPSAIVVISAHWEEQVATVQGSANPSMVFDYFGFPPSTYQISYPAPGAPDLARRIAQALRADHIECAINDERGYDHGVFVPLMLAYPSAQIPVLQLSLLHSLSAADHLALGRALQSFRQDNIVVMGSGFSFHNLRAYRHRNGGEKDSANEAFQDWLIRVCVDTTSREDRTAALIDWESAPHARYCHPREEHLLPLHVCAGMSGLPAQVIFDDDILGQRALAFLWR